jgi:hypothetical protein
VVQRGKGFDRFQFHDDGVRDHEIDAIAALYPVAPADDRDRDLALAGDCAAFEFPCQTLLIHRLE